MQSESSLSSSSNNNNNDKNNEVLADAVSTTNEMIFFVIIGIAYIAAGIWMLENKYYSKMPYILAAIGSIALIAFYIATRTINIPTIGIQDDVGTIDILSKVLQVRYIWFIDIHSHNVSNSMEKCYNIKSSTVIPAEMLEHEMQKIRTRGQI